MITQNRFYVLILLFLLAVGKLNSENKTWTGSISTDWNDAANWNSTGIPGSADNVIVPNSTTSGRMPTINSGTISLLNLTIENGGTLTQNGGTLSPNNTISISGSFIQNSGIFSTTSTITVSDGGLFSIAGTFSGVDLDVLSTASVIVNGTFNTNGHTITIDGGTYNQTGGIVITNKIQLKNGVSYNLSNGELQVKEDLYVKPGNSFLASGGTVRLTGVLGGGTTDYGGNVQFHHYIIDNDADYSLDNVNDIIKISGNFTNNNPNLDNSKGTLIFNGTSPQTIYSASTPADSKTMAANIIISNSSGVVLNSDVGFHASLTLQSGGFIDKNGSSIYVDGSEYTAPVPVELVSFNASVVNNSVNLNWKTATEINNYGFEILRFAQNDSHSEEGTDEESWEKIGFVNGYGNSNSLKQYSFTDSKLSSGSYSYRLKQIDSDGSFSYSNVVNVTIDNSPNTFVLHQNYPNPFNPSTKIKYAVTEESFVTIKVYNILGSEVATLVNETVSAGNYEVNFNASELASGTYIYKIQAGSFTSTKKMILSK